MISVSAPSSAGFMPEFATGAGIEVADGAIVDAAATGDLAGVNVGKLSAKACRSSASRL